MNKKMCSFVLSLVTGAFVVIGVAASLGNDAFSLASGAQQQVVWQHYNKVEPTDVTWGIKEYWVNCSSYEHVFTKPVTGSITNKGTPSQSFINSLPEDDDRLLIASMDVLKFKQITSWTDSFYNYYRVYVESEDDGGDLVIPYSYLGVEVVRAASEAFSNCAGITSIYFPDNFRELGSNAMKNCTGLTEVHIPSGLSKIESTSFNYCTSLTTVYWDAIDCSTSGSTSPFKGCSSLETIVIGSGVTTIGDYLFCDLSSVTSFEINTNVLEKINYYAFKGCSGITSLNLPDSVNFFGSYAFYNCTSLESMIIPQSITYINYYCFQGCSSLSYVKLHNGITEIYKEAFRSCTSLTSISIPSSVTSLGNSAFTYCYGLQNVYLQEGLESIGGSCFQSNESLTSIVIPLSVTSIGDYAFRGCGQPFTAYCRAPEKPSGWGSSWKYNVTEVVWNYPG